jgi:hypothetical protein
MLKVSTILIALLLFSPPVSARGRAHPHYTFVLPDGYVGWIQVIFNDPYANPLRAEHNAVVIDLPDSGIARTSNLRVHASSEGEFDQFFYRAPAVDGRTNLIPIPNEYVLRGDSHGGFGYADTGDKGPGYSWFIFIGPPQVRANVPMADWDKVVEEYRRTHNGNSRVELLGQLPVPGRMTSLPSESPGCSETPGRMTGHFRFESKMLPVSARRGLGGERPVRLCY